MRRAVGFRRKQLIVVAYTLPNQAGHYFNELLGYRSAAPALGLTCRIILPRACSPHLAASLLAEPVLDPWPSTENVTSENNSEQVLAFLNAAQGLKTLWAAIETHNPKEADILLFTCAQPLLIAGVGIWLARRSPSRRPSVFFRLVGDEFLDYETGQTNSNAVFFRIACSDLHTRPGNDRVFLLASNSVVARIAARAGRRRAFLTSTPKHLAIAEESAPALLAHPTVHVHLNYRSRGLVANLGEIIRRVTTAEPATRFVIKTSGVPEEWRKQVEAAIDPQVEMLPAEQDSAEYLANFSKCTVVLLAYEKRLYARLTSGVFIEAASSGKPVVAPAGTWMAQQIAAGFGVGTTFADPNPQSVAAAVLKVLRDVDTLSAAARALAPRIRADNSCQRYIEEMMTLVRTKPDMEPHDEAGDEAIDFSDP
jgi:hypothetical protein